MKWRLISWSLLALIVCPIGIYAGVIGFKYIPGLAMARNWPALVEVVYEDPDESRRREALQALAEGHLWKELWQSEAHIDQAVLKITLDSLIYDNSLSVRCVAADCLCVAVREIKPEHGASEALLKNLEIRARNQTELMSLVLTRLDDEDIEGLRLLADRYKHFNEMNDIGVLARLLQNQQIDNSSQTALAVDTGV